MCMLKGYILKENIQTGHKLILQLGIESGKAVGNKSYLKETIPSEDGQHIGLINILFWKEKVNYVSSSNFFFTN